MILEARNFYSADIDFVVEWEPGEANEVFFHLQFEIAEPGKREAYVFQVDVATPEGLIWFAREFKTKYPDHAILLFDEYSWPLLVSRIKEIIEKCTGDTWQESIAQLRLYFLWEYEGMTVT